METTSQNEPTYVPANSDSRAWATASHLSAFVQFAGIPAALGPLAIWLLKRDDPYAEAHAKEALNFNISYMIYGFVAAVSIILLVGLVLLPVVLVAWFVLVIVATAKASADEFYEYPATIRFIR
ncbi:MAG: DUF4870 domain-containing protein [Actinomycetota bacterium]